MTLGQTLEEAIATLGVVQGEATERATRLAVAQDALARAEEGLQLARGAASDENLEQEQSRLEGITATAKREHQEAAAALAVSDPDSAEARLQNARDLVGRLTREHQEADVALATLKTELAVRGESGLRDRLDAAESALVQVERDHERNERLADAVHLLYERLKANRESAQRSYVAPYR